MAAEPLQQHRQSTVSSASLSTSLAASRRGLSSPPSLLNARLFSRLSSGYAQELKIAELRAAYCTSSLGANARRNAPSRASLPVVTTTAVMPEGRKGGPHSSCSSRRGSVVANCQPTPSIMDIAASAGLLSLSPSDLVFESSVLGIAYYDFILSVSEIQSPDLRSRSASTPVHLQQKTSLQQSHSQQPSPAKRLVHSTGSEPSSTSSSGTKDSKSMPTAVVEGRGESGGSSCGPTNGHLLCAPNNTYYRLFLAKLDSHTNVEWFESVIVPSELMERNGIHISELSLLTMGVLVWRSQLTNARLLCLANGQLGDDSTAALEALKRATGKYKCRHHVLTIGQRRQSSASTHSSCSTSSYKSSSSTGSHGQSQQDAGMKLRILMCQSRNELVDVPSQALRDIKFLLAPSSNPLLCLCFPLT